MLGDASPPLANQSAIDRPGEPTVDAQQAERPSAYAKRAIVASSLGYAMDGFDLLIIGFALAGITASLHLDATQAASLATITLWGALVGGLIFGVISDYLGRVRVLAWSIIVFAVFTGLSAVVQNYPQMAVARFFAGVGLGAEFGIGMTLAAEAWPDRLRARATSYVGLGWQLGVLLAALVAPTVITHFGWRAIFAIGTIPAVIAFVFRRRMTEPERFVEHRAQKTKDRFPVRLLFSDWRTARTSVAMIVLTSVQNFGYYGIMVWLPTYLGKKYNFSLTKSGTWTVVIVIGMAVGIYAFGIIADRLGRRPAFWLFQVGALVTVLAYSQLSAPIALLIGGAVMGFFVDGMLGGYGALMAELYPTAVRATAQNVLFNIGRAVGALGPIWVAFFAKNHGFSGAIGLLAFIYVLDMVAMLFISERKGKTLPA